MADTKPEVLSITKSNGIAGQYQMTAQVRYPGEEAAPVTFVGSTYGGRVIMRTDRIEVFVDKAVMDRCGAYLDKKWIERFFS